MMSMLLKNGVSIVQALEIAESSLANVKYRETILQCSEEVKKGGKLSESFARYENLYPGFVPRMLTVGDRTGKTDEAFESISSYYEDELRDTLSNLSSIIEPILMVILGVGVAFIAISVLIPMYRIVSGVNQL
jgi:type IV pilus assembly protein PilC